MGGSDRPVYQSDFALDEDDFDFGSARALSTDTGDFVSLQSGSPAFAFWSSGPYVVGVLSSEDVDGSGNWFSAGSYMVDLVKHSRELYP